MGMTFNSIQFNSTCQQQQTGQEQPEMTIELKNISRSHIEEYILKLLIIIQIQCQNLRPENPPKNGEAPLPVGMCAGRLRQRHAGQPAHNALRPYRSAAVPWQQRRSRHDADPRGTPVASFQRHLVSRGLDSVLS